MNTKDQIIEAAKCSFALHGYEGTTLSQIAKEVGIQKPSIYNHFKSKNDLYLYVAEMVIDALLVRMKGTYERHRNENLETRLYLLFKNSCDFIQNKQEGMMYVRFLFFPPVELKEEVKTIVSRGDSQIEDIVNKFYIEGIEEGQLRDIPKQTFRSAFYFLLDGLFTESFIYDDFLIRFEEAWTVFWYGVSR
ncbi:TetR/AcrR family transcriptional regulator [Peribacillus sp. NPDC096379]|uniref:TetR/AcrR family transcriptional regulator n=1 Tax=Peribacillus sp. NPDC096379 TaxID=3364393 RepID=UPI00380C5CB0